MDRVTQAQAILAGRAWTPELVLRVASELVLNSKTGSLPLKDKVALVGLTIREMLADVEKAGKELKEGSTEKGMTIPSNLEDCKKVLDLLPVIVDLVKVPSFGWKLPSWLSGLLPSKAAAGAAAAGAAAGAAGAAADSPPSAELASSGASVPAALAAPAACFSFLSNFFQKKKEVLESVIPVHAVNQSSDEKTPAEEPASQGESVPPPS
jgi:hypothetical protein